jgi:signal transduction histidine kinase
MSANLQILVDSIDQGLLIVSPEGLVRLTNQAATQMFPVILGKRLAVEEVLVQVTAAARGYVRLPLEFEINTPGQGCDCDRLHLKLMDSPLGGGYLVLVRNASEEARFETIIANFANLLVVELGAPMAHFSGRLNHLLVEAVPDLEKREALSAEMRTILGMGEEMAGRITQLAAFAQLFSKAPIFASERIPVMDLVSSLLVRVRPLLEERDIKFHMAGVSHELPVIYGSRDWLVEALYGYIEHMVKNCRIRSDLELQARPYGNYVSLQIRNHGRGLPKKAETRSFLPFGQMANNTKAGVSPNNNLGLGMALCKHVVELHRGSMKLNEEDGDITAFVLELPAGAPSETTNPNLDAEQARRYAEDLTRLMQRQRKVQAH